MLCKSDISIAESASESVVDMELVVDPPETNQASSPLPPPSTLALPPSMPSLPNPQALIWYPAGEGLASEMSAYSSCMALPPAPTCATRASMHASMRAFECVCACVRACVRVFEREREGGREQAHT